MPTTPEQWQARREALEEARTTGTRAVQLGDGTRVEYSSDAELAAAIAFVDRELAAARGTRRPAGRFYFQTSKGL